MKAKIEKEPVARNEIPQDTQQKSIEQELENMPPQSSSSSLSAWFKSFPRRTDEKLPLRTNAFLKKALLRTCCTRTTTTNNKNKMELELKVKEISDKISIIYSASIKIGSIAARAVLDVIKAQDGNGDGDGAASTTTTSLNMARRTANQIANCTKRAIVLAMLDGLRARNFAQRTQLDIPVPATMNSSKPRAVRLSRWAEECDADARMIVDRINRGEATYARKSPRYKAAMIIAAPALAGICSRHRRCRRSSHCCCDYGAGARGCSVCGRTGFGY